MIEDYKEALKRLGRERATSKGMTICLEDDETNKSIIEDMAIYNKLYELEDIEEKLGLGIDLVTLFKADNNGFYYKKDDKVKFCRWCIRVGDKLVEVLPCYAVKETTLYSCYYGDVEELKPVEDAHYWSWKTCISVSLKDYGKSWALTKEELL